MEILEGLDTSTARRLADTILIQKRRRMEEKITIAGELTRDPIFVLLKKIWHCEDCEKDDDDPPCSCHSSKCPLMCATSRYCTEQAIAVFLTREEAEDYGNKHSHNLGEKGDGWDVWCTQAIGELAKLLDTVRMVK